MKVKVIKKWKRGAGKEKKDKGKDKAQEKFDYKV